MISSAQAQLLRSMGDGWSLVFWDPVSPGLFALHHEDGTRLGVSGVTGKSVRSRGLVEVDPEVSPETILGWNLPEFAIPFRVSEAGREELERDSKRRTL